MSLNPLSFSEAVIRNGMRRQAHVINVGRNLDVLVSAEGATAYEIGRLLKEPGYGREVRFGWILMEDDCAKGTFDRTGFFVAIKLSDKKIMPTQHSLEDPIKEIAAMQFLKQNGQCHPNIVNLIECLQDDKYVYSVLEYCEKGELLDLLVNGALPEHQVHAYFSHVLQGMIHLQRMGICHRDMSLENLLLCSCGKVVIIDFGMCLRVPVHPDTGQVYPMPPQGQCGKRNYMSPEIFTNRDPFNGFSADIWSLGVSLFTLLTAQFPYENCSMLDKRYKWINAGRLRDMLSHISPKLSVEAVDLLCGMLKIVPSERLTIDEILLHPWMQLYSNTNTNTTNILTNITT